MTPNRALTPTRRRRRGVALLLVLWLVALLAMVTMAASGSARDSGALVTARRADATARAMSESGVAAVISTINDSLRRLAPDSARRDSYLNTLDAGTNDGRTGIGSLATDTLGDGAWAVAVIDISSRLDVNAASADGLASLFSSYVAAGDARVMAERIVAHVRGDGERPDSMSRASAAQDSLVRALLGRARGPARLRHPVESLEELVTIAGIDPAVLARLTPLLTVDGDATVNRRSAPPSVLQAATGSVTEAPTRLLVVARGWQLGHPLTHEVQAVYDVGNQTVRLIRWRERTL